MALLGCKHPLPAPFPFVTLPASPGASLQGWDGAGRESLAAGSTRAHGHATSGRRKACGPSTVIPSCPTSPASRGPSCSLHRHQPRSSRCRARGEPTSRKAMPRSGELMWDMENTLTPFLPTLAHWHRHQDELGKVAASHPSVRLPNPALFCLMATAGTGSSAPPCPHAPMTQQYWGLPFSPKTRGLGNFPSVTLASLSHGLGMSSPSLVQPARPGWWR